MVSEKVEPVVDVNENDISAGREGMDEHGMPYVPLEAQYRE